MLCQRGRDIDGFETRGRENYRPGRHRKIHHEHFWPSPCPLYQQTAKFYNNVTIPQNVKTHLKRVLAPKAFYCVDKTVSKNRKTAHFEIKPFCWQWNKLANEWGERMKKFRFIFCGVVVKILV